MPEPRPSSRSATARSAATCSAAQTSSSARSRRSCPSTCASRVARRRRGDRGRAVAAARLPLNLDLEESGDGARVYTFAELTSGIGPEQRLRNLIEEIELADEVGLDVFGVGSITGPTSRSRRRDRARGGGCADDADPAHERRQRAQLDDPVRVFQQFATVDLLSGGRAEIMVGRGSFIESFPLFGYDLADYDRLFEEKLARLLELRETVQGSTRARCRSRCRCGSRSAARPSRPTARVRSAADGAAIIGDPERFVPCGDPPARGAGARPRAAPCSASTRTASSPRPRAGGGGLLPAAEDDDGPDRRRARLAAARAAGLRRGQDTRGATVGSPEDVAAKILYQHELFAHDRFLIQFTVGSLPHDKTLQAIELFGTEVAPIVRSEVSRRAAAAAASGAAPST